MDDFTGDHLQSLILEPSTMKSNMQIIDDMISYKFIDRHHHQQQQPQNFINAEIQSSFNPNAAAAAAVAPPPVVHFNHESKKEKRQWQSSGGGRKRKKDNERGEGLEKPGEVIHVRVKRGQATDSHSLAERVRRQKINERLKSLQNLVPGCYKTMGMAVMLEVITQYIQSLQNQIEFLSMKLSAASMVYESNSLEMNAMEALQGANAYEAHEMDRTTETEEYGGLSYFHPTWPS